MSNTARRINASAVTEHKMAALGYAQGVLDGENTDKNVRVEYGTIRELANDAFWDMDLMDPGGTLGATYQNAYVRGFRKAHPDCGMG